ncbi:secretion-regulating guanine nucleotide exchange factor isoform X2 [Tiliqua scincoides]|uniref:secretion-regulating guanine nucleotide exchange factor isoform X2 n=1 Tax=Tiliqua scincoides TaxID=71010 RepID=UPI003462A462
MEDSAQALFAWGANSYGQLGLGHKEDVLVPQVVKEFPCKQKNIRNITGGGGHSAVVTGSGDLYLCGQNKDGQLGLNHTEDVTQFMLCSSLSGCLVAQVACGWDFTIILAENGQVLSCGSNSFGQLGIPLISGSCTVPQKIESLKDKVVNVAAGLRHTLAITENGSVFQWGIGMASRAKRACQGKPIPCFLRAKEPCQVTGLENIIAKRITSGSYHAVLLTDGGELYVWGSNQRKQLVSKDDFLLKPQKIEAHYFLDEKVRKVWTGWTHIVAQTESGKVFTWGRGDYGQLGRSVMLCEGQNHDGARSTAHCLQEPFNAPFAVPSLTGASEIACGSEHNLAITASVILGAGMNMGCAEVKLKQMFVLLRALGHLVLQSCF